MKITVESTTKIVQLRMGDTDVPARIWQGTIEDDMSKPSSGAC